jgi:hypothetical protein
MPDKSTPQLLILLMYDQVVRLKAADESHEKRVPPAAHPCSTENMKINGDGKLLLRTSSTVQV